MSATFTLVDPSTGRGFREVPRASVDEVDAAIARAKHVQRAWAGIARASGVRPATSSTSLVRIASRNRLRSRIGMTSAPGPPITQSSK